MAGASAQREYDRRAQVGEQRVRTAHPRLGALILALRAKSVADVLAFRVEQHQVPNQAAPPRTPTAADLVASSYPTPPAAARLGSRERPQELAVLRTALQLGREADAERQSARAAAGTADGPSTRTSTSGARA